MAHLPLKLQWKLGKAIGEVAYQTLSRRRKITSVNIRLCFPELTATARQTLVRKTFHSNGIGIMEIGLAWFRDPEILRNITTVHGLNEVKSELTKGHGILLLGGHYSTLDVGGSLVSLFVEADIMQRDHNNPLMNAVMTRARQKRYGAVLSSKDLRGLLKRLQANRMIWYATDQDYGRKGTVFAPFFGIPAASVTTTSRIAQRSQCAVMPFSHFRREGKLGYDIYFHPALSRFPSGDDERDAARVNATIEEQIRRHPDQYLWMHRRFKTRPVSDPVNPYQTTNRKQAADRN